MATADTLSAADAFADGLSADESRMGLALALAEKSVGLASPNPAVGCVLVRDGRVVGEGFHIYDNRDHAEVVALRQAGADARGATAYVTLEPCSHRGRTGPCADALLSAGVARVVAATLDPNPQVAGSGVAKLRAAGVEATVGVREAEARELNEAFAKFIQTGRPFVVLKAALSLDGKLAPPPSQRTAGTTHWLTGDRARGEVHRMRHASDAILTGIGTVLADDPALTDRSGLPRRRPLLRVVLDSRLRLPLGSRLAQTAKDDVLVFCGEDASSERQSALEAHGVRVERIACSAKGIGLDLRSALARVGEMRMVGVLAEGGSALNGALLAGHLADKAVLFYAPIELGEGAVPFAAGIDSPNLTEKELRAAATRQFGPDTCVSGYLRDPWPPDAGQPR